MQNFEDKSKYEHILLLDEFMKQLWFHNLNKINTAFAELKQDPNYTLYFLFSHHPCMVKHYRHDLSFLRAHLREYTVFRARTLLTMMETYIPALEKSIFRYKRIISGISTERMSQMKTYSSLGGQETTFTLHNQKDINKFIINISYIFSENSQFPKYKELWRKFYEILQDRKINTTIIDLKFSKINNLYKTITVFINSHTHLVINIYEHRNKRIGKSPIQHSPGEKHIPISDFLFLLGIAAVVNKGFQNK